MRLRGLALGFVLSQCPLQWLSALDGSWYVTTSPSTFRGLTPLQSPPHTLSLLTLSDPIRGKMTDRAAPLTFFSLSFI